MVEIRGVPEFIAHCDSLDDKGLLDLRFHLYDVAEAAEEGSDVYQAVALALWLVAIKEGAGRGQLLACHLGHLKPLSVHVGQERRFRHDAVSLQVVGDLFGPDPRPVSHINCAGA